MDFSYKIYIFFFYIYILQIYTKIYKVGIAYGFWVRKKENVSNNLCPI